jgi:hypothetical protein
VARARLSWVRPLRRRLLVEYTPRSDQLNPGEPHLHTCSALHAACASQFVHRRRRCSYGSDTALLLLLLLACFSAGRREVNCVTLRVVAARPRACWLARPLVLLLLPPLRSVNMASGFIWPIEVLVPPRSVRIERVDTQLGELLL